MRSAGKGGTVGVGVGGAGAEREERQGRLGGSDLAGCGVSFLGSREVGSGPMRSRMAW